MAKKKKVSARPKSTTGRAKTSQAKAIQSKTAAFNEPDVIPSPITDGQPLNVYLVALGVNRAELVKVEVIDETNEFTVRIPEASKDPYGLAVSVVSSEYACEVTRNRRAEKPTREKLFGAGKLTITIRPAGGMPVKLDPVGVALIPTS